jgi:cytochrome c2
MERRHLMDVTFDHNERERAYIGGRNRATIVMALAAVLAVEHSAPSFASGDAAHGAKVYQDCTICHSLDKNEIGPKLKEATSERPSATFGEK